MPEESDTERQLIGARLKEARKLAGLSQLQVSKMMGLHRPTISEIESGARRVSADELKKLAEIYDVDIAWVVGQAPEALSASDPRLELAARELGKLKSEDLERVLRLFAALRGDADGENGSNT